MGGPLQYHGPRSHTPIHALPEMDAQAQHQALVQNMRHWYARWRIRYGWHRIVETMLWSARINMFANNPAICGDDKMDWQP